VAGNTCSLLELWNSEIWTISDNSIGSTSRDLDGTTSRLLGVWRPSWVQRQRRKHPSTAQTSSCDLRSPLSSRSRYFRFRSVPVSAPLACSIRHLL